MFAVNDRRKGENHTVSVVDDGVHWAIPGRNSIKSIVFHFHTPKLLERYQNDPAKHVDIKPNISTSLSVTELMEV